MKVIDLLLDLLIPALIIVHLVVSPYTKVEESFNLQATRDILAFGTPLHDVAARLRATYDHFTFPGAVPRTFVGALMLSGAASPILSLVGPQYAQLVVRGVLGLFNAGALVLYKHGLADAFGPATARWWTLLLSSQFHVIYYASRTLPNMFAFGLVTLAMRQFLPATTAAARHRVPQRNRLGIYLMVLAGVVFRAEVALLLAVQMVALLLEPRINLHTVVRAGVVSAAIALAISVPVDSYFWQKPIWPEWAGFYFNAIEGKSSEWGTSPVHYYFTALLPKLVLNPMISFLVLFGVMFAPTRYHTLLLYIPIFAFVAVYSLQPHKETRFIIYAVPSYTSCAAIAASELWTRRAKAFYYRLGSLAVIASILGSFALSSLILVISSMNYPGGEALWRLHDLVNGTEPHVSVHMDVLSCMTGVSLFQQDSPTRPFLGFSTQDGTETLPTAWSFDKTEDPAILANPEFWKQFDFALMENRKLALGKWEVVDNIYGYAGLQLMTPQHPNRRWSVIQAMWNGDLPLAKVENATMPLPDVNYGSENLIVDDEPPVAVRDPMSDKVDRAIKIIQEFGAYHAFRDALRGTITGGYWIGPRLKAKIKILRRVQDE